MNMFKKFMNLFRKNKSDSLENLETDNRCWHYNYQEIQEFNKILFKESLEKLS